MGISNQDEPITKKVKLNLKGLTREQKTQAKNEAGRLIVEGINDYLDKSKSPVSGGKFKVKKKDGERSILFEEGDLRDAIVSKNRKGDVIEVGVFKSSERAKSYNHNIGDTVPTRRFIPGEGEKFKKTIMSRVNKRINEIKEERETELEPLRTTTVGDIFAAFESASNTGGTSSGTVEINESITTSVINFPTIGALLRELGDG